MNIREYIAAQSDAPQIVKDREAEAWLGSTTSLTLRQNVRTRRRWH